MRKKKGRRGPKLSEKGTAAEGAAAREHEPTGLPNQANPTIAPAVRMGNGAWMRSFPVNREPLDGGSGKDFPIDPTRRTGQLQSQ